MIKKKKLFNDIRSQIGQGVDKQISLLIVHTTLASYTRSQKICSDEFEFYIIISNDTQELLF
jgi:hypothetical protein